MSRTVAIANLLRHAFTQLTTLHCLYPQLPDPSYFPLESLSASLLSTETFSTSTQPEERKKHKAARSPAGWIASLFGQGKSHTQQVTVPKFAKEPTRETLQLSGALQYGGLSPSSIHPTPMTRMVVLTSPLLSFSLSQAVPMDLSSCKTSSENGLLSCHPLLMMTGRF